MHLHTLLFKGTNHPSHAHAPHNGLENIRGIFHRHHSLNHYAPYISLGKNITTLTTLDPTETSRKFDCPRITSLFQNHLHHS